MDAPAGVNVAVWGLVFARVAGVTLLVPPAGVRHVPVVLRLAVAVVIAVPVSLAGAWGASDAVIPIWRYAVHAAENLAIGLAIGAFVAAIIFASAMAGAYLDRLSGWGVEGPPEGLAGSLFYLLAAAGFILTDGHLRLIDALVTSLYAVGPVPQATAFVGQALLVLPAKMFASSIAIAAPALLAMLVCRAVIAASEGISVELQHSGIGAVSGPLLGQVVLIVALPVVVYITLWQVSVMLEHLVSAFA